MHGVTSLLLCMTNLDLLCRCLNRSLRDKFTSKFNNNKIVVLQKIREG
jgi:hypothetical protein